MATTEQTQKSKAKRVLTGISIEQLHEFLNEDDDGYTRREMLLRRHYEDAIGDSKTSAYSRSDLLDRDMGKPKESKDITTGGQPLNSVVFDILDNDNNQGE
jgi:hypothetical protein